MTGQATFAIPGALDSLTGGYIYEKQVLLGLRRLGWDIHYLALPDGFPQPTPEVMAQTAAALAALPQSQPVLLDGFLTGAMPPEALADLRADFVAICHHPLAYETGLSAERAAYLKQIERANLARAAHVIVPSPHTARMLKADFHVASNRITVAAPGVPRPQNVTALQEGVADILVVGQLVPRKGHETLVEALAAIADLEWTVSIVGPATDAEHAADLRNLIAQLGLTERVRIVGTLTPEQLETRYARATVFALATQYEGYGMVFSEAMVHGLPIVSCAAGAVPDTVPADAGLLVAPANAPAFATALRRVLTDHAFRAGLAQASAHHGSLLPTWDDTAKIISDVLTRVGR